MPLLRRRILVLLPLYLGVGAALSVWVAWNRPFDSGKGQAVVRVEEHDGQCWATIYFVYGCRSSVLVTTSRARNGTDEVRDRLVDTVSGSFEYRDDMPIPSWAPKPWEMFADVPSASLQGYSETQEALGWPMRCVTGGKRSSKSDPSPRLNGEWGVIPWRPHPPIRPIPLGMLVDASLFGLAVWPIHQSLAWVWRWWRVHFRTVNQLCTKCGYDRRGLAADAKCPECGTVPAPVVK